MRLALFFAVCSVAVLQLLLPASGNEAVDAKSPGNKPKVWFKADKEKKYGNNPAFYAHALAYEVQERVTQNRIHTKALGEFSQLILLELDKDGKIQKVQLAKSTASRDADQRLIDCISKSQFKAFPQWYVGDASVIFVLEVHTEQIMTDDNFPIISTGVAIESLHSESKSGKAAKSRNSGATRTIMVDANCQPAGIESQQGSSKTSVASTSADSSTASQADLDKVKNAVKERCHKSGIKGQTRARVVWCNGELYDAELLDATNATVQDLNCFNLRFHHWSDDRYPSLPYRDNCSELTVNVEVQD